MEVDAFATTPAENESSEAVAEIKADSSPAGVGDDLKNVLPETVAAIKAQPSLVGVGGERKRISETVAAIKAHPSPAGEGGDLKKTRKFEDYGLHKTTTS